MSKRVTPQNAEAESSAIGCLLTGAGVYSVPLTEAHFYGPDNRLLFNAIRELADERHPIDITTVRARLEAKGKLEQAGGDPSRYLSGAYAIGGDAVLAFHFSHLEFARQRREAFLFCQKQLPEVMSGALAAPEFAEQLAQACAPLGADQGNDASAIIAEIEAQIVSGEKPEVFPTGFAPLDHHFGGGFHRGELIVIGADTGMGKSALMIQAAAACAKAGHPVVYFSLEMNRHDVFKRLASAAYRASQNNERQFRSAMCDAGGLPVTIYDETCDLTEIMADIRSAVKLKKCPVAIVDYLQIIDYKADSRELMLSEITRKLKNLAQSEGIVLITASQVNENGALRESRAIGHHANVVMFITADGPIGDDGSMPPQEITVAKFRRGARTKIKNVMLHGPHSRFELMQPERKQAA
jgi:replicative DNA helicase